MKSKPVFGLLPNSKPPPVVLLVIALYPFVTANIMTKSAAVLPITSATFLNPFFAQIHLNFYLLQVRI